MGSIKNWTIRLLMCAVLLAGCTLHQKILPTHDDVLTYDLPYDLTYLRTIEALENVPGWELEETEKEKGIIRVRNLEFSRFDDADKRLITVMVLRDSRYLTSVQLAKESQHTLGGNKILETISQYVSREL